MELKLAGMARPSEIRPFRPRAIWDTRTTAAAIVAASAFLIAASPFNSGYDPALRPSAVAEARIETAPAPTDRPAAAQRFSIGLSSPAYAATTKAIDYRLFDQRLTALAAKPDMVGMAVAVVEGGQISFLKGYGVTAVEGGQPVTDRTVFRWASLSKGVAATLVADLAAEGKLSLNEPIGKYSRTLRLPGGAERVATVEDVLSQRLGIYRNAYDDRLEAGEDPAQIRASLSELSQVCQPGACFSYQNVAYDSAREVVEKVTGESYAAAVKERLFAPLGMSSATMTRDGLVGAASWARPHVGRREVPVEEPYYRVPAAGGVNSSILDLALWMRAQMGQSNAILPAKVVANVHAPRIATPRRGGLAPDRAMSKAAYALGWRDYEYQGHRLVGHRGAVRGYRSLILFDPAAKTGIAVLWNSHSIRPVGAQLEVLDMFYRLPRKDWMQLG